MIFLTFVSLALLPFRKDCNIIDPLFYRLEKFQCSPYSPNFDYAYVKSYLRDVFLKRYTVLPINIENLHWYTVIIKNPANLFRSRNMRPQILVFDPKKCDATHVNTCVEHLKGYYGELSNDNYSALLYLHNESKGEPLKKASADMDDAVTVKSVTVYPQQIDSYNCGPYAVYCAKQFLNDEKTSAVLKMLLI